jgi:hypothetical protein
MIANRGALGETKGKRKTKEKVGKGVMGAERRQFSPSEKE